MATPVVPPPGDQLPPVTPPGQQPQRDPEVARLQAEVARQSQTVDNLKRLVTAPPPAPPQTQVPDAAALNREFFKDPLNASYAIAQKAVADFQAQHGAASFDTLVSVARSTARGEGERAKLFDKYAAEIEAKVASMQPQFRTNVNVWNNAVNITFGEHMAEIRAEQAQTPQPTTPEAPAVKISNEGGPAQARPASGPAPKKEKLSPEESKMAQRLGLTDDQYAKGKAAYEGQNNAEYDPLGKSSWDDVMTFSTREKRRKEREARERNQHK